MQSIRTMLFALLLLGAGCTVAPADKKPSDACHAGGSAQCHDMIEQNRGGQGNGRMGGM